MMVRRFLLGCVLCLFPACAATTSAPASRPAIAVRTTDHLTPEALRSLLVQGFPEGAREYVQVIGYNALHLTLLSGGHYTILTYGCQGQYAVSLGTWALSGSRMLLTPLEEHGDFANPPLRVLHVRLVPRVGDVPILIPDADLPVVQAQGPTPATCFHDPRFEPWHK